MKSLALALVLVGCHRHDGAPTGAAHVTPEYRADIENLCDSLQRSGADKISDDTRTVAMAMWLGKNVQTEEGHKFLVSIQSLVGEDHARALDDEAHRVGLASCALSAEWRK